MPGLQTDAEPRSYALATEGHRGGNKNVHSQGRNCEYVGQTKPNQHGVRTNFQVMQCSKGEHRNTE